MDIPYLTLYLGTVINFDVFISAPQEFDNIKMNYVKHTDAQGCLGILRVNEGAAGGDFRLREAFFRGRKFAAFGLIRLIRLFGRFCAV